MRCNKTCITEVSLLTVRVELLMDFPLRNHDSLAGGKEPEVSHRTVCTLLTESSSFDETIFTLFGFTVKENILTDFLGKLNSANCNLMLHFL